MNIPLGKTMTSIAVHVKHTECLMSNVLFFKLNVFSQCEVTFKSVSRAFCILTHSALHLCFRFHVFSSNEEMGPRQFRPGEATMF